MITFSPQAQGMLLSPSFYRGEYKFRTLEDKDLDYINALRFDIEYTLRELYTRKRLQSEVFMKNWNISLFEDLRFTIYQATRDIPTLHAVYYLFNKLNCDNYPSAEERFPPLIENVDGRVYVYCPYCGDLVDSASDTRVQKLVYLMSELFETLIDPEECKFDTHDYLRLTASDDCIWNNTYYKDFDGFVSVEDEDDYADPDEILW